MYQIPFNQGKSSQKRGNLWEKNVSHGLSQYLKMTQEGGHVIPLPKQIIRGRISRPQKIDILVDNAAARYFGVECKSSSRSSLSLGAWFRHNGKDGQFFKESEFLKDTKRIGFVALVMLEAGSDENFPRYGGYFIPWNTISRIREATHNCATSGCIHRGGFLPDNSSHIVHS